MVCPVSPAEGEAVFHAQDLIAELVLDSVLDFGVEGRFVTGAIAADLFFPAAVEEPTETNELSRISRQAPQYAEALWISDPGMLSSKLYFYNRIPLALSFRRRFATAECIGRWLGLEGKTAFRDGSFYSWSEVPAPSDNRAWRFFCRDVRALGERFKLYINVHADFLPEAIKAALPILSQHGFGSFKICRELSGLVRPDKFVAYARSQQQIVCASQVLIS